MFNKYQIYNKIQFLLTKYEQNFLKQVLKLKISKQLRHFDLELVSIQKYRCFGLKAALFAEKRIFFLHIN
jgi:hypothetical protein